MARRYKETNISALSDRTFFFDANILIYIFWSVYNKSSYFDYSTIYHKLVENNTNCIINMAVLSEIINRVIRIEYSIYLNENQLKEEEYKFKKYRNSFEGKETQQLIYDIICSKILPYFEIVDDNFSQQDLIHMLKVDSLDFNDKIIVSTCLAKNAILLTHDKDFSNSDIDILSKNSKLF